MPLRERRSGIMGYVGDGFARGDGSSPLADHQLLQGAAVAAGFEAIHVDAGGEVVDLERGGTVGGIEALLAHFGTLHVVDHQGAVAVGVGVADGDAAVGGVGVGVERHLVGDGVDTEGGLAAEDVDVEFGALVVVVTVVDSDAEETLVGGRRDHDVGMELGVGLAGSDGEGVRVAAVVAVDASADAQHLHIGGTNFVDGDDDALVAFEVVAEVGEELHIAAGGADGDGVAVGHLVVVVDDGVLGVHGVCETQKKNE